MSHQLLISVAARDTRIALLEEGRLAEYCVETHLQQDPTGNIYTGRVAKVLPGMAAAFVDIGLERPAYLYVEEVADQWDDFYNFWLQGEEQEAPSRPGRRSQAPIEDLLHEGQELLVQVFRPPLGNKGARLTTHITLPGHYLVYLPTMAHLGVSRRIPDEAERTRLRALLEEIKPPEGGLIARTVSQGQVRERLARERDALMRLWKGILQKRDAASPPALLHQELKAACRVVRDLFNVDAHRIIVDDPEAHAQILEYLTSLSPWLQYQVELYNGAEPLFHHFGLDLDWSKLLAPQVWLKSGGYLVIDNTEALTAIDVNTGRFTGRDQHDETILKTNLEAAREIARQLRLRNLGGLIVIDFIDMEKPAHRDLVHRTFVEALRRDRAKTTVLPLSPLGVVEMTRQRLRDSLSQTVMQPCPCCRGRGEILAAVTVAHDLLRQLTEEAREFPGARLTVTAHSEVLAALEAEGREVFTHLSQKHQVELRLQPDPQVPRDQGRIAREWPRPKGEN
ncbi:MAG: Rne/Rng family ribonuclease [Deltaproteobacteria bacterium]|nr:Rne/Rng family ribonuclease [Deltaproteobacteria bacterium]